MQNFREVIGLWETAEELGREVNATGLQVRAWKRRNSIPPSYWPAVVAAARSRRFRGITLEALVTLGSARKPVPQRAAS